MKMGREEWKEGREEGKEGGGERTKEKGGLRDIFNTPTDT